MALIIGTIAILITLLCGAVVWAFRASLRDMNSPTWWFAMAFLILAAAIVLRALYWDVGLPLLRLWAPGFAAWWSEMVSGRMINIVFSVLKMMAFYCALKCRQMMIPEEERDQWPWYVCWMHPSTIRLLPWRW